MAQMMNNAKDPQGMMRLLSAQNPMLAGILQTLIRYKGNAKEAFYVSAKQQGVNPDTIISLLK